MVVTLSHVCVDCGSSVEGASTEAFGDAFLAHVRSAHADWPYPDDAVRSYAEACLRLTGGTERLESVGEVAVHPVTTDRIDDWLSFFDHDAFADRPYLADCYCLEFHLRRNSDVAAWQDRRDAMSALLRDGRAFGYLAYVDGRPAAWVNASKRCEYPLFRLGDGADPSDDEVIAIVCFLIGPPYRGHGLAGHLLDAVVAGAPERGISWVEGYPFIGDRPNAGYRGPRSLYESHGFEMVQERNVDVVMRRRA